jgi:hypothetical protein
MPNNSPPDMFADPAGWEDALVRRLTSKMAHDADVDEEQIQGAIDGTEKEIFNEATGADEPDDNGDRSWEQSEGIDGEPLSDQEQLVRAIQGDEAIDGYIGDRPLEHMDSQELRAELERKNALLARQSQDIANNLQRPQQEAQLAAARDQLNLLSFDPDQANAHLANYISPAAGAQIRQLQEKQMNDSFDHGYAHYGQQFADVYQAFTSQDPTSPSAQRAWNYVLTAPTRGEDQAEALMKWADSPGYDHTIGSRQPPPFMARTRRASPNRNREPSFEDMAEANGGFGHAQTEEDIFSDATKRGDRFVERRRW